MWLEVADNGIGIPPEDRDRIFERFYRVDKARSGVGGTGLGLSIAQEIIHQHEGSLTLVDRPGPGTTLRMELKRGGAQAMRKQLSRRQVDRLENILILLLACSALFLLHRTRIFQKHHRPGDGRERELLTRVQDTALARGPRAPDGPDLRRALRRQYDQEKVDSLYQQGLNDLLMASVDAMDSVKVSQETWQQAVTQSGTWVYYDFLYDVSFTGQSSRGRAARRYLITGRNGRAESVYYYNEGARPITRASFGRAACPCPGPGRPAHQPGPLRL